MVLNIHNTRQRHKPEHRHVIYIGVKISCNIRVYTQTRNSISVIVSDISRAISVKALNNLFHIPNHKRNLIRRINTPSSVFIVQRDIFKNNNK